MISLVRGNILSSDTEAVVNPVNCAGVMGKGLALQFRLAHPLNYVLYKAACERGDVQPGKLFTTFSITPRYIINFPTKRHWSEPSLFSDIEAGLYTLAAEIRWRRISSIAIPALGCGLGGLNWSEVRHLMDKILVDLDETRVFVYEP